MEHRSTPLFKHKFKGYSLATLEGILRLPPVRRWITEQRTAGRHARVWLAIAPLAALYIVGFVFIMNEEIFTGTMAITLRPPAD